MASEAKRGFQRIFFNYARLLTTLSIGVIYLPVVVSWIGLNAFGLLALVGSSVGFANLFRYLTEQSLIRELGAAYHEKDPERFRCVYNSAFLVSAVVAAVTVLAYGALMLIIPLLEIPREWVSAARWIVGAQAGYACLLVLLSPVYSMYLVKEEFGWSNFWRVALRMADLSSALILAYGIGIHDVPAALKGHGILTASILSVVVLAAVGLMVLRHRDLMPAPRHIRAEAARTVFRTFGWNSVVHLANGLHEYGVVLLMNLAFGVFGNAVFGIAFRLGSYVRMATTGVTYGLEAVSARVSSAEAADRTRKLVHHSTRLQALVAIPAGLGVFVLARPLLELWIGRHVENPELAIPPAVLIAQILAFAITSRAIADGWMLIMYGAGYVRRYAPLVLAGGAISPLFGGLLVLLLPDAIRFNAPAIGYTIVFMTVHFFVLPSIGARCFGMPYRDLFAPLVKPALCTALCSPILIVPAITLDLWTIPRLAMVCASFGLIYAAAGWFIVLQPAERTRFAGAARRHLLRGAS